MTFLMGGLEASEICHNDVSRGGFWRLQRYVTMTFLMGGWEVSEICPNDVSHGGVGRMDGCVSSLSFFSYILGKIEHRSSCKGKVFFIIKQEVKFATL